jgi:hypothetical protein
MSIPTAGCDRSELCRRLGPGGGGCVRRVGCRRVWLVPFFGRALSFCGWGGGGAGRRGARVCACGCGCVCVCVWVCWFAPTEPLWGSPPSRTVRAGFTKPARMGGEDHESSALLWRACALSASRARCVGVRVRFGAGPSRRRSSAPVPLFFFPSSSWEGGASGKVARSAAARPSALGSCRWVGFVSRCITRGRDGAGA